MNGRRRDADLTEHTVEQLIAQRVYALASGDEDLNDHDEVLANFRRATQAPTPQRC